MWAALAGKPGEVHGRYTSSCQVEEESDVILKRDGPEVEEKLWVRIASSRIALFSS